MWRAEIRKLTTTRTIAWLWFAAIAVIALGTFSTIASSEPGTMTGHFRDQPFHMLTTINMTLIALLVGVRSITDEYRYQTISWTMLSQKRRAAALAWKALVAAAATAVLALSTIAIGLAVAFATFASNQPEVTFDLGDAAALGSVTVASGMFAALGVAVGSLIRHQVPAVAASIIWVLAIENLGAAMLGGVGQLLPGQAAFAAAEATVGLARPAAFALLLGYVAVVGSVAAVAFERRPLSGAG